MDDGDIGDEAGFHDIVIFAEAAEFLALGDQRADAGLGEKGRNASAAGADAFGQGSLRIEFQFEIARRYCSAKSLFSPT